MTKIIHLYFYTDSIGFPRIENQALDQTWPFLLKDRLEQECGLRTYMCLRGLGGATISEIRSIFLRDIGYFRGQGGDVKSFVVFNTGIVDAAPQPFTYPLRKIAAIPVLGPKLWYYIEKLLHPCRPFFQKFFSYRRTSPLRFQHIFNHMVRQVKRLEMESISIDTPLTPLSLEARSPGLRESVKQYNRLKNMNYDVYHVAMDWVMDEHYLEDGHHFRFTGHRLLADRLFEVILRLL